jgi:acetoin utilization deacetylase AcuC-like enzyme
MRWVYDRAYDYGAGLPGAPREVHGFLLRKPTEIAERLVAMGVADHRQFESAVVVSEDDLIRVHDARLIAELHDAQCVATAVEFPDLAAFGDEMVWASVVQPQLRAAGGTVHALRAAVDGEWAVNLSGGFHHARRDLSHGFCLVNDIAVGLARLRQEGIRRRVLIIDLDLHQGDGNATVFAGDRETYTVSVHEENIFPIPKARSDLDIGLAAFTGDADYLVAVDEALAHARQHFTPEMIVYVAGSDPYQDDPLGSLQITQAGFLARDQRVVDLARALRCPLMAVPAGGYTEESPSITAATFRAIAEGEHATVARHS